MLIFLEVSRRGFVEKPARHPSALQRSALLFPKVPIHQLLHGEKERRLHSAGRSQQ